jgi:hypothetical protein
MPAPELRPTVQKITPESTPEQTLSLTMLQGRQVAFKH